MENQFGLGDFGILIGIIQFIVGLILIIVFLLMAININIIRKEMQNLSFTATNIYKEFKPKIWRCNHCGFRSSMTYDFCPICEKNSEGITIPDCKKAYEEMKNKKREKPKFRL